MLHRLAVAFALPCCAAALGDDAHLGARTVLIPESTGVSFVTTTGPGVAPTQRASTQRSNQVALPADGAGCGMVWTRNLIDAIYTTTAISVPAEGLAAGSWLNPPMHVEFQPLAGDGTPDWETQLTDVEVAASRDGTVVAAVDDAGNDVVVHKLDASSGVPDWSATIEAANPGSFRTVAVSADGSTIAVLVTVPGATPYASVYFYGAASPVPVAIIDAPTGTFGRNLSITDDGRYVACMAGALALIADRDNQDWRYTVSAGASNDAIALSGDGNVLVYGWQSMTVRTWDGSTYAMSFTTSGPTSTLTGCALSGDGTRLAAAWAPSSFDRNIIELYELPGSTPAWSYTYTQGGGAYQDVAKDLEFTAAADLLAVASWGDQLDTNDEVHVFGAADGAVIASFDTPGSMFDADIARLPDGSVAVVACGKHIHANETGRGGDLFSWRLDASCLGCAGDATGDGVVGVEDLLAVLADWGPCGGCSTDFDGNGTVDVADLLVLLAAWGPC